MGSKLVSIPALIPASKLHGADHINSNPNILKNEILIATVTLTIVEIIPLNGVARRINRARKKSTNNGAESKLMAFIPISNKFSPNLPITVLIKIAEMPTTAEMTRT